MLCYNGEKTAKYVYLGVLKLVSLYDRLSIMITSSNKIEICGYLQTLLTEINTYNKIELFMPEGKILDISVNH